MIPPSIGHALRAGSLPNNTTSPADIQDRLKVIFYHDTQHFAFGNQPLFPPPSPFFFFFLFQRLVTKAP